MSSPKPARPDTGKIFEENILLKQTVNKLRRSMDDVSVVTMDDINDASKDTGSFWSRVKESRLIARLSFICVVTALLLAFIAIYLLIGKTEHLSTTIRDVGSVTGQKSHVIGEKFDSRYNPEIHEPRSFPDIDYALFGYNILRGYPLAVGHDPGLTRPIFISDYTDEKLTADLRYYLPKGFVVVPDISCVTSFTSTTIQDQYHLTKSLSASATVAGGGWGVQFSASAEYKTKSSEVSTKETVYINSEAKCDYYLSMIDEIQPPSLTKSFLMMARTIKTESDVFRLFDYYGTHYLKQVTFGARLVYENKMSKQSFKSLSAKSYSVTASASYSGLVRVEGSAGLSESERKQAGEFRSKVETSTISVGAPPPPSGGTNRWASEVKENPVPTKYVMAGIEELFTKKFMQGNGIDYDTVHKLVNQSKVKYCGHLQKQGIVDSCKPIEGYIKFLNVRFGTTQYNRVNGDERSCIKTCTQDSKCIAVNQDVGGNKCDMFKSGGEHSLLKANNYNLVLFIDRLNINDGKLKIRNAALNVQARADHQNYNDIECEKKCMEDKKCIVFSYLRTGGKCGLYQQLSITEDSIKWDGRGSYLQFSTNKTLT